MVEAIKKVTSHIIVNGLLNIALGLAVLINPQGVFRVSVGILSIYLVIIGLINIFEGLREKKRSGGFGMFLAYGLFYIVSAAIIYYFAVDILRAFPFILGLVILFSGFSQLFRAINFRNVPNINTIPMFIYSAVLIGLSLFFIFNTSTSLVLFFQIYGVILIIMGALDLFFVFYLNKKAKQ